MSMPEQIDSKKRIIILFEAYLAFEEEATISAFYKWLVENKITGYNYYLSRQIGMIIKASGKFERKGNKWRKR